MTILDGKAIRLASQIKIHAHDVLSSGLPSSSDGLLAF